MRSGRFIGTILCPLILGAWSKETRASLIRLVGMVLAEQDDEWQDARRYFRPETMATIDAVIEHEEMDNALLMAS
jgi:hypothetical protein